MAVFFFCGIFRGISNAQEDEAPLHQASVTIIYNGKEVAANAIIGTKLALADMGVEIQNVGTENVPIPEGKNRLYIWVQTPPLQQQCTTTITQKVFDIDNDNRVGLEEAVFALKAVSGLQTSTALVDSVTTTCQ